MAEADIHVDTTLKAEEGKTMESTSWRLVGNRWNLLWNRWRDGEHCVRSGKRRIETSQEWKPG